MKPRKANKLAHNGKQPTGDTQAIVATVEEVASMLQISRAAAYAACKNGELPSIRIGRLLRVPIRALEVKLQGANRKPVR